MPIFALFNEAIFDSILLVLVWYLNYTSSYSENLAKNDQDEMLKNIFYAKLKMWIEFNDERLEYCVKNNKSWPMKELFKANCLKKILSILIICKIMHKLYLYIGIIF